MGRKAGSWSDVRGKGYFVAVGIAFLGAWLGHSLYIVMVAKAPGDTHCYGGVCHRVYTLDETRRMIGQTVDLVATHYDAPGVDKFNVGQYTSSGEEFDAENAARTSASNYPDGTELLIWHPGTRRAAHVRVNDFGPFKGNRTLDLTRKAAEAMGWAKNGVATLKVTVIFVPPATDPRYRKARVYPPSLGLIGVVESHQYAALAETLIQTAAARNGIGPGPALPDVPTVLAAVPTPAPSFRSEGVVEADERALEKAQALAALNRSLPSIVIASAPYVPAIFTSAPQFRTESFSNAEANGRQDAIALATVVASLPTPVISTALPLDLQIVPTPLPRETVVAAAVPLPASQGVMATETGPFQSNRSTVAQDAVGTRVATPVEVIAGPTVPVSQPVQAKVEAALAPAEGAGNGAADAARTIATARSAGGSQLWGINSPVLWIGIALMLSSLWGARSIGRARRHQAAAVRVPDVFAEASAVEAAVPSPQQVSTPVSDAIGNAVLAQAQEAAERAEARAREVLVEQQTRPAATEDELLATEDLARELSLRAYEREQEVATRARAEVAAAEHEEAQRELAALEAVLARARAERDGGERSEAVLARGIQAVPRVQPAEPVVVRKPAPVPAPNLRPMPEPPRAEANDAEMARFPGLADRRLVGGILNLPGAATYWGNTIIAKMRLDGSARSGSPMRVDGMIDGACTAPVMLISEGAVVTGVVAAETIVILGRVNGIVSGRNVFVASTAQVDGEVFYQTISIDPQAHCDVSFSRLSLDADPIDRGTSAFEARAA